MSQSKAGITPSRMTLDPRAKDLKVAAQNSGYRKMRNRDFCESLKPSQKNIVKTKLLLLALAAASFAILAFAQEINTDTGIIDSTKVFPVEQSGAQQTRALGRSSAGGVESRIGLIISKGWGQSLNSVNVYRMRVKIPE